MRLIIITLFMIVMSLPTFGEQEQYSRDETEQDFIFNYVWRDANDTQQTLSFNLNKIALKERELCQIQNKNL